jgi:hypothetical protein
VLPLFKTIEESGILPHYTLSHEPGVSFAADARRTIAASGWPSSPLGRAQPRPTRSPAPMRNARPWS